jgi:anti-sigma factor RsiW
MNTIPDETKLALWLDDELTAEELAAFEMSIRGHPEHFAAREEVRRWRQTVAAAIPASEEPPHPDFFSSRISRVIRESVPAAAPAVERGRFSWRTFLMPVAACAGMVLAFIGGMKTQSAGPTEIDVTGAPKAIPVDPILYTPDSAVTAEWFASNEASATVIVLGGIDAIPDTMDFFGTAVAPMDREIDRTADVDDGATDLLGL